MRRHRINSLTLAIASLGASLALSQPADSARFNKGTYTSSGGGMYNYSSPPQSSQSTSTLTLALSHLQFTTSRFAFGGEVYYRSVTSKYSNSTSRSTQFGVGPTFRYYVIKSPQPMFVSAALFVVAGGVAFSGSTINFPTSSSVSIDFGTDLFVASSYSIEPYARLQYGLSGGSSSSRAVSIGFALTHFVYD